MPDRAESFTYSDGDAIEDRLLACLQQASDVSSSSIELRNHIRDWPSEYHLSSGRHNLLRFIDFSVRDRVLELGCGCGAITRFLGESGAQVWAIESSPRRVKIARERCRDLANVQVDEGNLLELSINNTFDYVTLIGVLEYAPCFAAGKDAVHTYLTRAAECLSKDGLLILAIENRLGLKYLAGRAEDHAGKPFYGIYDLYVGQEPVTWGRRELAELLSSAGFAATSHFFPFPDYKLPRIMVSEHALSEPLFDVAGLLACLDMRDPGAAFLPHFYEHLAWRAVAANDLLPALCNSHLVVAAKNADALRKIAHPWLGRTYTPERLPAYATETIIRYSAQQGIVVEKRPIDAAAHQTCQSFADGLLSHHPEVISDYVHGMPYIVDLQRRLARNEGLDSIIDWSHDWLMMLCGHARGETGNRTLPGSWLDVVPQNLIRTANGKLHRIDSEWDTSFDLPLSWVIVRGLANAIAACPTPTSLSGLSLRECIRRVAAAVGVDIDHGSFRLAIALEVKLHALVYGYDETTLAGAIETRYSLPPKGLINAPLSNEQLASDRNAEIERLSAEIARIKSTLSWRITKPLRLLANLSKLIGERAIRR